MAEEAARLAVLERRADESQLDRHQLWEAMRGIGEIKEFLARMDEKLFTGAKAFEKTDQDMRDLTARLEALEKAQAVSGVKMALIWSALLGAGGLISFLLQKITSALFK